MERENDRETLRNTGTPGHVTILYRPTTLCIVGEHSDNK